MILRQEVAMMEIRVKLIIHWQSFTVLDSVGSF